MFAEKFGLDRGFGVIRFRPGVRDLNAILTRQVLVRYRSRCVLKAARELMGGVEAPDYWLLEPFQASTGLNQLL